MRSNTRSTSKIRKSARIAAVTAAAGIGIATVASAAPAFATGNPAGSVLNGTVVIASTLTIQPSTGAFTLNATPGTPTLTTFTTTIASNDSAGYTLQVAVQQQFTNAIPNPEWSVDTYQGQGGGAFATTVVPFAVASGTMITEFTTGATSGNTQATGGPTPYSQGGSDILTNTLRLALPGNTLGSPAGGYQGSFVFALTGN